MKIGSNVSDNINHPNFFGVGAAKSGTTSLWQYLSQHPEICMPTHISVKEPSFFCNTYGISDFNQYLNLFSCCSSSRAVGETSHSYLSSPESANWIKATYPNAKIFMILRNPVDRAYSLYNWMISHGYEWITTFEKGLEAESSRLNNESFVKKNPQGYFYNYLYFHSGLYYEQIKRYKDNFDDSKLLIFLFEELQQDPQWTIDRLYRFLEVDATFKPKVKVHNERQQPLSVRFQFFARNALPKFAYKLRFLNRFVLSTQRQFLSLNNRLGSPLIKPMSPQTRQILQERYRADIRKTGILIDRDLSNWFS